MRLPSVRQYPKEIIIGSDLWDIRFVRRRPKGWTSDQFGECDPSEQAITILFGKGVSKQDLIVTVIHEVLHAIEVSKSLKMKHLHVYRISEVFANLIENL